MSKGFVISVLSIVLLLIVTGCKQEENPTKENEKPDTVFREEDINKASEMIALLEDKMLEFQKKVTKSVESGEIELNNDASKDALNDMADDIVLTPFLEKYPNSLKDEDVIVSFESTTSEPCPFGNCTYDGIAVPEIYYEKSNYSVYTSKEFKISQLIFTDATSKFNTGNDEEEKAHIRFLKSKSGNLILTSNPFIVNDSLYIDELDEEFLSIKSDVPESEIETEEKAFRQEVEDVLAEYPPLQ